jgi:hypothetical protein
MNPDPKLFMPQSLVVGTTEFKRESIKNQKYYRRRYDTWTDPEVFSPPGRVPYFFYPEAYVAGGGEGASSVPSYVGTVCVMVSFV